MRCSLASVAACCDVCRAPAVHLLCTRLRSLVLTLTTEESPPHRTIVHERRLSPNGLSVTAARCVIRIYTQKIKGLEFFLHFAFCNLARGARAAGAARSVVGLGAYVCGRIVANCAQPNISGGATGPPASQPHCRSSTLLNNLHIPPKGLIGVAVSVRAGAGRCVENVKISH